jgi:hypothetical protein
MRPEAAADPADTRRGSCNPAGVTPAALLRRFARPFALLCLWALVPPYSIAVVQAFAPHVAGGTPHGDIAWSLTSPAVDVEEPTMLFVQPVTAGAGPGGTATAPIPTGFRYSGGSATAI